jgi:membrane protein DedA with SNARE-associated domain
VSIKELILSLVILIDKLGYLGIFVLMAIESSFIPLPSEIIIPPAGYLVYKNEMNFYLVIISGTLGSLIGALANYYISLVLGRPFLVKYGKYFFISNKRLFYIEKYFKSHGEITTFIGRLLPGVRHYISIPAGLGKMNIIKFISYTLLGAGIWVIILTYVGYFIGGNLELLKEKVHFITILLLPILFFIVICYIYTYRKSRRRANG